LAFTLLILAEVFGLFWVILSVLWGNSLGLYTVDPGWSFWFILGAF